MERSVEFYLESRKMNRIITLTALILIVTAIILGAFGAHALKELISEQKLISFEVGVRYQFYHGLAFLIIGLNAEKFQFSLKAFYRLVMTGVLLFSVSIYLLSFSEMLSFDIGFIGPVTPIGGLLIITGWLILIVRLFNDRQI